MLSKMKITQRLLFGFGIMMLMIAWLGGNGFVSLHKTEDGYVGALRAEANYVRNLDALVKLEMARVSIWKYLATGEEISFGEAQKKIKEAEAEFTELATSTQDPERKAKVQEVLKLLTLYHEKVAGIVEIKGRNESLDLLRSKEIISDASLVLGQLDVSNEALEKEYEHASLDRAEAAHKVVGQAIDFSLLIGIISLALGAVLSLSISRSISNPVKDMTRVMASLANGDHEVDVPCLGRKDELGSMAHAVEIFKMGLLEMDKLEEGQREAKRISEQEKKKAMRAIADDFEHGVYGVVDLVSAAATEMQSSAQSLASMAEQTSQQSVEVAAAVEQTSRNVQTVASATEELTASIAEISGQMNRAGIP